MSISSASFPEMYLTSVNPLKFLEEKAALIKENEELKKQLEEKKDDSFIALKDSFQVERVIRHMNDVEDMRTPYLHHCSIFLRRYDELSEQGKEMLNKECGKPWVEVVVERAHEVIVGTKSHLLRSEMMKASYKRTFSKHEVEDARETPSEEKESSL